LRKNYTEVEFVFNALVQKNLTNGWQLVIIENKTETEIAEILAETAIFLNFSYPDGLPLTVKEAIFSGYNVIGYRGFGGKEIMDHNYCSPIESSDTLAFVHEIERIINVYEQTPKEILQKVLLAKEKLTKEYSLAEEQASVVSAWDQILA